MGGTVIIVLPLYFLFLSLAWSRDKSTYLCRPTSNMASFSSNWSGLFLISILITFFSLQGDVNELTWVIVFSFLVRYCLWSLFLSLSLCSYFLQATNRAFLFSFFIISDVHYSYGLFFLAVKISHSRSHSGSRFLLYLNLKGLLSLCPFPSPFPSLLFESCVNIFEKGKIKMLIVRRACMFHRVITYPALKYFSS